MEYKIKTSEINELKDLPEVPDDQKVIIQTQTLTETKEFTLGEKKREIESIDAQIVSLVARKQELLDLIESVSTTLDLTVSDLIVNPKYRSDF